MPCLVTFRRRVVSLVTVCLVACTTFVGTASGSAVCTVSAYGPRLAGIGAAAAVLGIPAYLARDARANLHGEISTLGPTDPPTSRPGLGLGLSARGLWGRHGYRVDWFDVVPGGTPCNNYPGYWSASLSYVYNLVDEDGRELSVAVGGGLGVVPHDAYVVSLAVTAEQRLSELFSVSGRIRYLPNFPTIRRVSNGEPEAGVRVEQGLRMRARFQWRLSPAIRPHVSLMAGLYDSRDLNTLSDGTEDTGRLGLDVSGLVGFESRWGRDN